MSTPFDHDSVDMLTKIGVKGFKVASCDISNFPLLKKIALKKLPILLSTGASNLSEVRTAVNFTRKMEIKNMCYALHLCYPTQPKDINLSGLIDIKKNFKDLVIGLSDHTLGIHSSSTSVALGVRAIEKHFTVDKKLKKSADHWLSINPKELKQMRKIVDEVLLSLGKGGKKVLKCEKKTRLLARRSIVLKNDLKKGTKLSEKNITCKRPGNGMPPKFFDKILGKKIKKDLSLVHQIKFSDLT